MLIEDKLLERNCIFVGDREIIFNSVKTKLEKIYQDIFFFEVQKLNISVDDIRRMISFANKTTEGKKIIMLSSFYWEDEAQNAMLKVLEETPGNTLIFLFANSKNVFLQTIRSRVQTNMLSETNRYLEISREVLALDPNERLENKKVKKILSLKITDYNFEKNTDNEKKDRESHILFLESLMQTVLENKHLVDKNYLEKILKISTIANIPGGSPHLFIEWLLLSFPKI
jgi:DNA polymerase III delta prime subunit